VKKKKHQTNRIQAQRSATSLQSDSAASGSSWLNQVEIWFSKIQRAVIARGIFTSKTDLSRKLLRYIKQYNKTATPFHWRYKNVDHRIKPDHSTSL